MSVFVLHVAETLRGGIASYLDEILPHQADRFGHSNVAMLVPDAHLPDVPTARLVLAETYRHSRSRVINAIRLARETRRLVLSMRPHLLHAHSTIAGLVARLALGGLPSAPRVVYCPHGWYFDGSNRRYRNTLAAHMERHLARSTSAVVCISDHERNLALEAGIAGEKLVLIRNGIAALPVPAAKTVDWPPGRRRCLFIGRFDYQKGLDVCLDAMRLAGEASFAYAIGAPVLNRGPRFDVPINVVTLDWMTRAELQRYLASADVLLVPSRWEGFGLAALEAMRARKAVIASRVGGLRELIVDGVTGRLVAPGSPTELAEAILAHSTDELNAMGAAGYARFSAHYTSQRLNRELDDLYARL